ncbi:MAG: extensin family protein [Kofleriaceae bacterium]
MARPWIVISLVLCVVSTVAAAPRNKSRRAKRTASSRLMTPADITATPVYRYANMTAAECEQELAARRIPYELDPARGVAMGVRLSGPLRGVEIRTRLNADARATTPYEISDCRLVLALDDFAAILERHDIVGIRHYSMYRPPPRSWPDDRLGGQHRGALAIDVGQLIRRDGSVLDIERGFHGRIGARTCGDGAKPRRTTPEALELRAIICETVAAQLFNVVLTPNFNRAHRNHFHLEVMAGVKWILVR